jgi:putative addiction module component (TIGR02574 family)
MSDTALQLLPQILALPADDREMLARELISSLDEEDEAHSQAFLELLDNRIDEMRKDPNKRVTAEEVFRKLEEKFP